MANKFLLWTKRLPILVIMMFLCTNVYAQFYDSDDEVRIYACPMPYDQVSFVVFNFNGQKGAMIQEWGVERNISADSSFKLEKILEDPNYLEKNIYGKVVIINYDAEASQDKYCYKRGSTKYIFSKDGYALTRDSSSGKIENFTRISKEELIKFILKYESHFNRKWR